MEDASKPFTTPQMETEKAVWNTDQVSMLLHEMRNNIPKEMRKRTWIKGEKALDWSKIAFEPFSPEECQQKWQEILQTISKARTLPELVVAAEDGISNPCGRNIINPEYPKQPATVGARFYQENFAKLKEECPNVDQTKLLQRAAEKYKMLSEEEKRQYEENYKLAKEEYKRQVAEFRKHHKTEVAVSELPRSGFSLFCQEQSALIGDVSRSDCRIKWRTRWQNLTESQRKEYCRRCKELKKDQEEKNAKDSILSCRPPRSGYGLFCHGQRGLMGDVPVKNYPAEWKRRWNELTETQRDEYRRQHKEMNREHSVKLNAFLEGFTVKKQEQILKKYNLKRPKLPKEERRKEVATFPCEPKRPPVGANIMFFSEQMMHLKEIKNSKQRFSVVNQMWRHLSETEKASYEKKLDERVLQYSVELQRWFKTLNPTEQEQYRIANPSRCKYLDGKNTPVDEEVPEYQPSDSEDEALEDSSSEEDVAVAEDEDDDVMFDMF